MDRDELREMMFNVIPEACKKCRKIYEDDFNEAAYNILDNYISDLKKSEIRNEVKKIRDDFNDAVHVVEKVLSDLKFSRDCVNRSIDKSQDL